MLMSRSRNDNDSPPSQPRRLGPHLTLQMSSWRNGRKVHRHRFAGETVELTTVVLQKTKQNKTQMNNQPTSNTQQTWQKPTKQRYKVITFLEVGIYFSLIPR